MPDNNASKLWLAGQLLTSETERAREAVRSTGRALPCHVTAVNGALVTVAFDVATPRPLPAITIPKLESNWIRMPTQVGDIGMTVPCDAFVEYAAQIISGTAPDLQPFSLSGLIFVPVSSAKSPPANQNAAIAQGPDGFIGQTTQGTPSSVVTDTSGTTITFGSTTIVASADAITLTAGGTTLSIAAGKITIDGIVFETHVHGGVTAGGADTTGPQA